MRMRKKKHGDERLAACAALLAEKPQTPISAPFAPLSVKAPLCLEIGCGKGGFAVGMAAKYPERCFYAMEKIPNVMIAALEKAVASADTRPTDNLRFIIANADTLEEWFAPGSLDHIYLNFSDPWPKARHAARRLTHTGYLKKYFQLLKQTGILHFKTDNVGLFDFTLEQIASLGLSPTLVTRDLHASVYQAENVMTEYEINFSSRGFPIHMLELLPPSAKGDKE